MLVGSRKRVSSVICMSARSIVTSVLWFCEFLPNPFLEMGNVCLCVFVWLLIHYCAILWLLLWTWIFRINTHCD